MTLTGCGTTKTVVVQKRHTVTQTLTVTTVKKIAPAPTVFVETPNGVEYKPTQISYYGGHQYVGRIKWKSYGGDVASGSAVYAYDTCDPDCATGKYTYTPITIQLMTRELCNGVVAYRDWSLVGAKLDPTPESITTGEGNLSSPCR
jgi:hypothetical protein